MSDYTPPTLVIPTPGGNPGDGSINGNLTFAKDKTGIVFPSGIALQQNDAFQTGSVSFVGPSGSNRMVLEANGYTAFYDNGEVINGSFQAYGAFQLGGSNSYISVYKGINTVGMGVAPLYGKDVRTGLTAADASALTLYTTTAAGQAYRLMGRILATAGTSPSATYTIKWTEGGATITKTLTISALDSDSDLSILIQPNNATAITAQLTAISGTGTTVNVAATVEQMA